MNKIMNKAKQSITSQKKKYIFLITVLVVGMISGILFIFFISKEDKSLVKTELETFFTMIKSNKINYFTTFINSFFSNFFYLFSIWLLGISIIGIPIIIFMLFLKGFVFGFSISSIISHNGLIGIPLSISTQFPHSIILLICMILISFYATNFSIKLFKVLFLKSDLPLGIYFKKYNLVSMICIICLFICSLIETFLSPVLINLFL